MSQLFDKLKSAVSAPKQAAPAPKGAGKKAPAKRAAPKRARYVALQARALAYEAQRTPRMRISHGGLPPLFLPCECITHSLLTQHHAHLSLAVSAPPAVALTWRSGTVSADARRRMGLAASERPLSDDKASLPLRGITMSRACSP